MEAIVIYTVAYVGLAYIVGHSFITKGIRLSIWNLGPYNDTNEPKGFWQWAVTMLECPACFGTWFGFLFGLLMRYDGMSRFDSAVVVSMFTAGVGVIFGCLTGMLEIR